MHSPTSFSCNQCSFSLSPPNSPSWHCLIGRRELLPSHLPCYYIMFCSHALLVRFQFFFPFSVYTVNLCLLCHHYLSLSFFVLESCRFPFFISFVKDILSSIISFYVLVVPLMCVFLVFNYNHVS